MKWRSIRGVPGDQIINETAVDIGRDLLVLLPSFFLILLLGSFFPVVGYVGEWLFLTGVGFLALRFFFGCLVGLAESVLEGVEGGGLEGSGWIVFVTGARIVELALAGWMALTLFQWFP